MDRELKIGERIIKDDTRPYIIAEIGVNHEGSIEKAKLLIEQAKEEVPTPQNFKRIRQKHLLQRIPHPTGTSLKKLTKVSTNYLKFDNFEQRDYESFIRAL